jgi:uncharacterized protein (TIRG00374 family)
MSTLSALRWDWLVLAAGLALLSYFGRALRWAVLMRPVRPHPGLWNLTSATAIGFTAIALFGRPGELVRPYLISVKERVPLSSQLAAWLLERIYDLLMALAVFGYALSRVQSSDAVVGPAMAWVLGVGGRFVGVTSFLCLLILLLFRHFSEKMRRRLLDSLMFLSEHHHKTAEKLVNAFVQGMESTRSYSAVALLSLYTVAEWMLIAGCYLALMRAFGDLLHMGLTDVLIFMGFVAFGAVVQIPGVGGGVQVVAIVVLTELFQIPLEVATSVALVVWAVTFVVIVPPGLILALREGLNLRKLKHLEEEVES